MPVLSQVPERAESPYHTQEEAAMGKSKLPSRIILGERIGIVMVALALLSWGAGGPTQAIPPSDLTPHAQDWRTAVSGAALRSVPAGQSDAATRVRLEAVYGAQPMSFEANRGQTAPQVKFLARTAQQAVFLTPTAAV